MLNATACFLRSDSKTLFIYRNKGESDIHNGYYVPPGGRTERGERGIDCIVREFKEETCLDLINPRLKVIATFYNEERVLGGKNNPEDWCVEIFRAARYFGNLREEHSKAKPFWIPDVDLPKIKIYPGDRKILELFDREGIYEVVAQYSREDLVKFDYKRVD